ncbi:FkbM family methyltransferase [Pedobacter polaris]|uniref:FkbM family methyltransferase n=1 Tax=Pedobacter polaris TaxID=2571273 RepID=A0A4U1CLL9_9SPHI|nr:FkbM family methyltransferase [Pedobacter polaris]TKC08177.1 FkbM family methyltransferase [Pedobacter polaris]
MLKSINSLFKSEFNQKNKLFALKRFFYWKTIRLFKLKNVIYPLWEDRKIYLNFDSFHGMWLMYNYIVDWEEFNFISRFLKPDDQVGDVGSNMGFYTIWMSKFVKTGKIHAFEPDDINFNRLKDNVNINALSETVAINNLIVSEIDGTLNFTTELDGENHITEQLNGKNAPKKSVRLDTYATKEHISDFKFIKIDTEGFELSVLKGAEKLLDDKLIKVIQLEINEGLKNANIKPEELVAYLSSKAYKLCRYDVSTNQLHNVDYQKSRENYFATFDIEWVNTQLLMSKASF